MSDKHARTGVSAVAAPIKRVVRYMLHYYKYPFIIVVACILINAVATVIGASFPQKLVDNYIMPMLSQGSDDFGSLRSDLIQLALSLIHIWEQGTMGDVEEIFQKESLT